MARHHGARYAETLTDFKWIARAGLAASDLERTKRRLGTLGSESLHDGHGEPPGLRNLQDMDGIERERRVGTTQ